MLKVKLPADYPPEPGRYARGNDFSPVAVCVILDTFDFAIPQDLQELVVAGLDAGAAIAGMLQTENVGLEKILCNVVANPNIRHIVLCGRESVGHLCGQALMALKQNGLDEKKRIIGTEAPTGYIANLPAAVVERFRNQVVTIVNLMAKPGQQDRSVPGLNLNTVAEAVKSCFQETPTQFMGHTVCDMGAFPEPPIIHKIAWKLAENWGSIQLKKVEISWLVVNKLLPGGDCKECGEPKCSAYAIKVAKGKRTMAECRRLNLPEHATLRQALEKLLS